MKITEFKYAGIYTSQVKLPAKLPHKFKPPIPLTDIFNIPETRNSLQEDLKIEYQNQTPIQEEYRLHAAIKDSKDKDDPQGRNPYAVVKYGSNEEWLQWNRNSPVNSPYKRKYIFSMARMPKANNLWIFGGIFVVQRGPFHVPKGSPIIEGARAVYKNERFEYDIYQSVLARHFIGKMIIKFDKPKGMAVRFDLENQINKMKIVEILP